jgi:DNA helicase-2/ATP-dependent DNA helicase PcrA
MLYGRTNAALASRFLKEIPESVVQHKGGYHKRETTAAFSYDSYSRASFQPTKRELPTFTQPSAKSPALELNKGDMVQHTAFGRGMVLSVLKMGGDALLEIAFDDIGTKKLMSKTASAHMKKL